MHVFIVLYVFLKPKTIDINSQPCWKTENRFHVILAHMLLGKETVLNLFAILLGKFHTISTFAALIVAWMLLGFVPLPV